MMRFDSSSLGTLVLGAALALSGLTAGCGSAISSAEPAGGNGTSSGTTGAGGSGQTTGGGGGAAPATGVPCDVATVFATSCNSCHGSTPSGGAPISLVTLADLTAKAPDGKTYAEDSLARMQAGTMPPGGGATPAEIATLQAWIGGGMKEGPSCGSGAGGAGGSTGAGGADPFQAPAKCTSGQNYQGGDGSDMEPGKACNHCHNQGEGPTLAIAGTVYPSAHEPDDCIAADVSGAQVIITDANGTEFTLNVRTGSGNFRTGKGQYPVKPYTAKVVYQGRTRAMASKQSESDCNFCHTQNGANGAPGRVLLP
jgi:hypothetical protein